MDENPHSPIAPWPPPVAPPATRTRLRRPPAVPGAVGPPGRPPRRSRALGVVLVVAVLIAAFVIVAVNVRVDDYAITPGDAQPVAPLVKVPADEAHPVHGSILLTDVYVTQLTIWGWITTQFDSDAAIVPATDLVGPASQATQLVEQGYITMAQAQQSAKVAALTRLGYQLSPKDVGVMVTGVAAGSAATGHLTVGQTITAVDGVATTTSCGLSQAMAQHPVGRSVQLTVERTTVTSAAVLKPGPTVTVTVRLGPWPKGITKPTRTPATCPGIAVASRGYLGVQTAQSVTYTYPFPVAISTKTIGGPSAGLAMTLAIMDTLSGGDLTGGKVVAVTGTIAPTGTVGRVGGVPQKTVAVERAGASAFIVPYTTLPTARSKDIPSLHVYGVRTLSQALAVLHKLGGTIPPTSGS